MTTALTELTPTLTAIPAADVERPDIPMPEYLQEILELLTFLTQNPAQAERLKKVGFGPDKVEAVAKAHAASQEAETNWNVASGRNKPQKALEDEKKGYEARSAAMAACRWNLRADRHAQGVLDEVQQGEGIPDLIQDQRVLASLIDSNAAAFAKDETFDPVTRAAELRTLAATIESNAAGVRTDLTQAQAIDLRDRAYTHLDTLADELKEAGRYVFRLERAYLRFFQNRYQARAARRSRRKAAAAAALGGSPTVTPATVTNSFPPNA